MRISSSSSEVGKVREEARPDRHRHYEGWMAKLVTAMAVATSLYHIVYLGKVLDRSGIYIMHVPHRAISLACILVLAFLLLPATKKAPRDRLPWYDVLLMLLAIAGPIYLAATYERALLRFELGYLTTVELVLSYLTLALVFEACRRAVGLAMPLIALCFVLYVFFGNYMPGFLQAKGYGLERAAMEIFYSSGGLYGVALGVASTVVIVFIIFASFLFATAAGDFFTNFAFAAVGRFRGGPAKAAVVASSLFGTISGAAIANVATTGTFTIPLMKKVGYQPHFAGAVEAVASVGGQITPPVMGAIAFIMAEWLGIRYWQVCVAAFLPAVLYYIALFMMVDAEAVKENLAGLPRSELPSLTKTLRQGWFYVLPLIVLVYLIGALRYSPETAVFYALGTLILVSMFRKETRLGLDKFIRGLRGGSVGMLEVTTACAVAGVVIGAMNLTGTGLKLSSAIVSLSGGNLFVIMALAAAAAFVLGMGLAAIPCYIMVAVFVAPALVKVGVLPIAAHLFAYYWAVTHFITPPVCLAAYVAAGIAGSNPMRTGWAATRLGIVVFIVPFMFVYNPVLLLRGPPAEIALGFATSVVGVTVLACALAGRLLGEIHWLLRVLLFAGAVVLILPGWQTDLIGVGIALVVLLWQWRHVRRAPAIASVSAGDKAEMPGNE